MQDRYSLSPWQARCCRIAAAVLWGATAIAAASFPIFWAGIGGTWWLEWGEAGWVAHMDRIAMLPSDLAVAVRGSPARIAAFDAYVHRPDIRALLTALVTIRIVPYVLLFASSAMALWRLGTGRGIALTGAFPWMKRAALAAIAVAVLPPVIDAVRGGIVAMSQPGIGTLAVQLEIELEPVGLNLLLALTLLSVAWALEAGTRAARDMDEFV